MQARFPLPLFLFVWLQCALFVHPVGTIMSDAILSTSVNVVEQGTLEVDVHSAIDLMVRDGKYYAGFGPGQWLLAVPYYAVLRPLIDRLPYSQGTWENNRYAVKRPKALPIRVIYLQVAMVWLFLGPLTGVFFARFYQILRSLALDPRIALPGTLAASTGTMIATYSCMFSRQWLAALLIALVALRHFGPGPRGREWSGRSRFLWGLVLGYGVAVDYMVVFGVAILALLHTIQETERRRALAFLGGIACVGVAMAAYHTWLVGNPLLTPYQLRVWHDHNMGFAYKGRWYNIGEVTQRGFTGLGLLPSREALYGLTFGSFKGLFFFSPVLLFALAGLVRGLRDAPRRSLATLCLAQFLVYFWIVASTEGELWWSSWPIFFGPRYLIYGVPFLALGVFGLRLERSWTRVLFQVALVISCVNHVLAMMFQERNLLSDLEDPWVQSPLPYFLTWLFENGPRIPFLDQPFNRVDWPIHTAVLGGYILALAACVLGVRRLERRDALAQDPGLA